MKPLTGQPAPMPKLRKRGWLLRLADRRAWFHRSLIGRPVESACHEPRIKPKDS
jgi:hypothetical protein